MQDLTENLELLGPSRTAMIIAMLAILALFTAGYVLNLTRQSKKSIKLCEFLIGGICAGAGLGLIPELYSEEIVNHILHLPLIPGDVAYSIDRHSDWFAYAPGAGMLVGVATAFWLWRWKYGANSEAHGP